MRNEKLDLLAARRVVHPYGGHGILPDGPEAGGLQDFGDRSAVARIQSALHQDVDLGGERETRAPFRERAVALVQVRNPPANHDELREIRTKLPEHTLQGMLQRFTQRIRSGGRRMARRARLLVRR